MRLHNVFTSEELRAMSTTEDSSVVQSEGERTVSRKVNHYNLIINLLLSPFE